jgi:hypothetical protein
MHRNEAREAAEPAAVVESAADPRVQVEKQSPGSNALLVVKRLLREPLLHFLVIAGVLFAAYDLLHPGSGSEANSKRIELTVDDLRQLEIAFTAQ